MGFIPVLPQELMEKTLIGSQSQSQLYHVRLVVVDDHGAEMFHLLQALMDVWFLVAAVALTNETLGRP